MSISRRAIAYLVLIFSLFLIFGLVRDIWQLLHADERVKEATDRLTKTRQENKVLKDKLQYYQSDEFLETQIRDKLQLIKPGETMVILPDNLSPETDEVVASKSSSEELANWQKWLKLFW